MEQQTWNDRIAVKQTSGGMEQQTWNDRHAVSKHRAAWSSKHGSVDML
jgi:hypothetical protein